ncbi:MAG TPA: 50S ribosomal protein L31, partial [Planctomycetaceae bacterium]|nr:50S ribosomal protein L31 [Planctomycetaceae bacterium]
MQKDIHPDYMDTEVSCGCGNSFTTRSTVEKLVVEICSACHPFYTGTMKYVDSAGRVEKFQKKYNWGKRKDTAEDETATEADTATE